MVKEVKDVMTVETMTWWMRRDREVIVMMVKMEVVDEEGRTADARRGRGKWSD